MVRANETPNFGATRDAAAEVVNATGSAPICLVCEHASHDIPAELRDLGLHPADRMSHAIWDPGAAALARTLSTRLDAPLVLARISRAVYDCNRPPERPDAVPSLVERIHIPGNANLAEAERQRRVREVYEPFHEAVAETLDAARSTPALVTIHSFTPVWNGTPRRAEIGLLHDADPTLAKAMLAAADPGYRIELNVPYSAADGVTHTLARHAGPRGLRNVMVEVRNDLLEDAAKVASVADTLEPMLRAALNLERSAA